MSNTETLLEERRAALNAVLESKEFSRAPALAKLLKYLCEKTFEGRMHEIKEFSIATEVYARAESFGERRDSVVRVEVSRLRKRLANYYADEGASHTLHIVIPAGTYQPKFESQTPPPPAPAAIPSVPKKRWRFPVLGIVAGAVVVLVALIIALSRDRQVLTTAPIAARTSQVANPLPAGVVPLPCASSPDLPPRDQ